MRLSVRRPHAGTQVTLGPARGIRSPRWGCSYAPPGAPTFWETIWDEK